MHGSRTVSARYDGREVERRAKCLEIKHAHLAANELTEMEDVHQAIGCVCRLTLFMRRNSLPHLNSDMISCARS